MSFLISGLTANIQLPCPERNVPAQFLMCRSPSHVAGSILCPPTKIPKPSFTNDFRCLVPPDQGAPPGLDPTFRDDFTGLGTLGLRAASALSRFLASLASFSWSILLERMDTTKRP